MNTREHLSEAGSRRTSESQPRSLSSAPGSSPTLPATTLSTLSTLSTQKRPPQHLLDQRRHTVDYSAWSTQGAFNQFLCVDQIATQRSAAGSDLSNKYDSSMASPWSSHSSESSFTSISDKQEINSSSINLVGNNQRSSNRLHPNAFGQQQHPDSGVTNTMTDNFGRRASMSQLSFYGGVWDQPDQVLPHRHSSSFQMGYDTHSFPVPASTIQGQAEEDSVRNTDWDKDLSGPESLATIHDDLSFLIESASNHNLALQTFSQRQRQHLPSSLSSSRRNSRILPNPIQPPGISHARKQSVDELIFKEQDQPEDKLAHLLNASTSSTTSSDLSIPEDDSLTASSTMSSFSNTSNQSNKLQHGGFVPGYDPWAEKSDIMGTKGASAGLDIQSQRRKSESVLHDLSASNLDYLTMRSIYQQSDSLNVPTGSSIPPHLSDRAVSPTNNSAAGGHTKSGQFTGSRAPGMRPESMSYEHHPLSRVESRESDVTGVDTGALGHHLNSTQSTSHPHFETTIPTESGSSAQLNDGTTLEMCGLCGVQLAIVPFGSCGHSPPCPFCTHGVIPAQQSVSSGRPTMPGADADQQNRHYSFLHVPQQTYSGQQGPQQMHLQRPQRQRQTFANRGPHDDTNSDDMGDGYPLNRQYHQTFPTYGAAHATALLWTSSLQLDTAPIIASGNSSISGPSANHGNYAGGAGPTDHFVQNAGNGAHQKPLPGFFPLQASTHGGQNAQRQQHSHRQGLDQYAPSFQPGLSMAQQYHDGGNMAAMGRPGMINPPTGAWREGGSGVVDYTSQEYAYQQQIPMPPQYLQQRHGSQQHMVLPPTVGNFPQGYQHYGHAMNNLAGPGAAPGAPSAVLSFPVLPDLPPAVPPAKPKTKAIQWAVVRVTNIPWDVSLQDMLGFFAGFPYPPEHLLAQNVHILMDRTSGKTFNSAFIELALTTRQAGMVAQARNQRVLKGRQVSVELSSQDELLRSVFPKWTGDFVDGEPLIPGERVSVQGAEEEGDRGSHNVAPWLMDSAKQGQPTPPFVTRDEINALLVICRNYKLHFSRKCAERPFENILSILAKYPWHQSHRVLPLHRDHIFELLKLSIESLRMHLSKEYNTIHPTLLTRMVRCAVLTPAFTERQKNMVLVVAGVTCPEDLVGWMAPPAPLETAMAPLDTPGDLNVVAENAEGDSVVPSDPDISLAKGEHELSEVKSIEEAIECLGISESATGEVLGGRSKAATATDAASPVTNPKEVKPSMPVTTWAAVVAPSSKAAGPTESASSESTPTATPAPPSNTSLKSGARDLTPAPSYAAAVVQTTGGDVTPKASSQAFQNPCGNLELGSNESGSPSSPTSLGSLVAHSSSNAWKSLGSHYRHNSGRSLSISGISSFASPNTQLMPVGTIPYTFPSLTSASAANSTVSPFRSAFLKNSGESFGGDGSGFGIHSTALIASGRHHRGGSLPKLAIPRGASETTSSSTTASLASSLVATPFNTSPVSATPAVTGEKSTSESILNAIKTITQSTPRLTKSGSVNQMPLSVSSTLLSGTTSTTGQSSGSIGGLGLGYKQQRREGGETL
ncbi:hypothetical protein KI688_002460 [Linnemannia hyalina]|uniref:RRM domain-containing protein n=1 Tax=Linnemannia hyalina TaxID=64524 RepID=A0A9P8BRD4_9FUNG|nr:hypothetical protein KI688_002460 [Linnemannia hyalina]